MTKLERLKKELDEAENNAVTEWEKLDNSVLSEEPYALAQSAYDKAYAAYHKELLEEIYFLK
jgi:hypothetical protein